MDKSTLCLSSTPTTSLTATTTCIDSPSNNELIIDVITKFKGVASKGKKEDECKLACKQLNFGMENILRVAGGGGDLKPSTTFNRKFKFM